MSDRQCAFAGCTCRIYYVGLCRAHYEQRRKGQELKPLMKRGRIGITVRISEEALAALGDNPSQKASEVIESWAKRSR